MLQPESRPTRRNLLDTVATIALIAASVAVVWSTLLGRPRLAPVATGAAAARRPEPPLPRQPVSLEGAARLGSAQAKVAVLMYSDFQCPYCGRFAKETLPILEEKYVRKGLVQFAFRQFPLPSHPFARRIAEAAECAERQDRFWKLHDALFESPAVIDEPTLATKAAATGLEPKAFYACLDGQARADVERDLASGRALQVTGTPTFFVGTLESGDLLRTKRRFAGSPSVAAFDAALTEILKEK